MLQQLSANVRVNLKFYRRNRLLAGVAILFIAVSLLYAGGSILFSTSTGRFDLTRQLFDQLTSFAFIFVAAVGLVLVAVQVRGKAVKLIFTKPCSPETWLASAFLSAITLGAFLYAAIFIVMVALSMVWHFPFQTGFVFMSAELFFEAVVAMSYLTFLSMVMHPVIAIMIAVIFNETVFFSIRTGLIAAIKNTGGNIVLPALEKLTYLLYMLTPMFSPYDQEIEGIKETLRVAGGQWRFLAYSGAYALALTSLFYLLTLLALKRKNFV
jgi:hypothetical protein